MPTFILTAVAALTFWSIVYLVHVSFDGDSPNFRTQSEFEFFVNAALLLMIGWMAVGVTYAFTQFKMSHRTAFATCLAAMAAFAYVVGAGTHKKMLQPTTALEKKFDRVLYCKTSPKAPGC